MRAIDQLGLVGWTKARRTANSSLARSSTRSPGPGVESCIRRMIEDACGG